MRHSSARRAQVEPVAALVSVAVLGFALTAYAATLTATAPPPHERDVADPALDRVATDLRRGSVVYPTNLSANLGPAPDGYRRNVTIRSGGQSWTAGPTPPEGADVASEVVPVATDAGVVTGRLRVEVWT